MEIYYVACFMTVTIAQLETKKIESKITEYFASELNVTGISSAFKKSLFNFPCLGILADVVQSFKNNWEKFKKPIENAIVHALKENYGYKAMNVYVRRMQDPYKVSKGYYHSDNQVQITLADLELDDLPYLWMPEVNFLLPLNLIQIGASLSKMIIRSNYVVFRNKSDIIYDLKDQNFYENSPFRFQQVQNMGQVGIIIEGCVITGMSLATLSGSTVNLGFSSFNLSKCQYTFEISTPGSGSPPVVAKYYPLGTGLNIEHLLMRSLREELMPKLQATMFSYINTSAILGDSLPTLQQKQEELFHNTHQYLNDIIRNLNRIVIKRNSGVVDMEDFNISWNDSFKGKPTDNEIYLSKMVMSGLETAYSSHVGGPYKQPDAQISEEIRFGTLRVRGSISYQSDRNYEYNFVAEIEDFAVEILLNVNKLQPRKQLVKLTPNGTEHQFYVTGWRRIELSIPRVHFIYADALVTGFLLNSVPKYIMDHLIDNFDKALEQADSNKAGKLNIGQKRKEDDNEALSQSVDLTEFPEYKGKKPLYMMSSDDEGNVHVEPYSREKDSASNEKETKQDLIHNVVYDTDYQKRLIGNEDEMLIISGEASGSQRDGLVETESNKKSQHSPIPSQSFNQIRTDKLNGMDQS